MTSHTPSASSIVERPSSSPRPRERLLRGVDVERHLAAREVRRVDAPEREVGVRDGDPRAAAAVAGGAGVGAGALRANAQAARLRVRDRAATRADRVDVHDRHQQREALRASSRTRRRACRSRRGSRRSSFRPCRRRSGWDGRAGARVRRRPSSRRPGPESRVCSERSRADWAVTMPPEDCITCSGTDSPWRVSSLSSLAQVAAHDRRRVGVDHRGRRALVLAPLLATRWEREIATSSSSSRRISSARSSCAGFTYENRKPTATAPKPSSSRAARPARTASSSSGSSSSPA